MDLGFVAEGEIGGAAIVVWHYFHRLARDHYKLSAAACLPQVNLLEVFQAEGLTSGLWSQLS